MDTEDYIISETTKIIGEIIEKLDEMSDDFKKVNVETLANLGSDALTTTHQTVKHLNQNLGRAMIVSMVLGIVAVTPSEAQEA